MRRSVQVDGHANSVGTQPDAWTSTTASLIAAGGSGFEVLRRNTSKQDTGISLRDALRVYLNTQNRCKDQVRNEDPTKKVADVYGAISCLDPTAEPHDGRIRPVFE